MRRRQNVDSKGAVNHEAEWHDFSRVVRGKPDSRQTQIQEGDNHMSQPGKPDAFGLHSPSQTCRRGSFAENLEMQKPGKKQALGVISRVNKSSPPGQNKCFSSSDSMGESDGRRGLNVFSSCPADEAVGAETGTALHRFLSNPFDATVSRQQVASGMVGSGKSAHTTKAVRSRERSSRQVRSWSEGSNPLKMDLLKAHNLSPDPHLQEKETLISACSSTYRHAGQEALQDCPLHTGRSSPKVFIDGMTADDAGEVMEKYCQVMDALVEEDLNSDKLVSMHGHSFQSSLLPYLSRPLPIQERASARRFHRLPSMPGIVLSSKIDTEFMASDMIRRTLVLSATHLTSTSLSDILTTLLIDQTSGIEDIVMYGFPDLCVKQLVQLTRKLCSLTIIDDNASTAPVGDSSGGTRPGTPHRRQTPVSFHQDLYHRLVNANVQDGEAPEEKPLFELVFRTRSNGDEISREYNDFLQAITAHSKRFEQSPTVVRMAWLVAGKDTRTMREDFSLFGRSTQPLCIFLEKSIRHSTARDKLGLHLNLRALHSNTVPVDSLTSLFATLLTSRNFTRLVLNSLGYERQLVVALSELISFSISLLELDLSNLLRDHGNLETLLEAAACSSSITNLIIPCVLPEEASAIVNIVFSAPSVRYLKVIMAGVDHANVCQRLLSVSEAAVSVAKEVMHIDVVNDVGQDLATIAQLQNSK